MQSEPVDLLVIGGGVNGTGIARDAAGRGLSVVLAERGDLAGATSAAATKLIHGGLRYLEQYEFRLVREALGEREVLLKLAPHIIWPLRFVLPHHPGLRPAWMIRIGLFLYDHLARRVSLPGSVGLDLANDPRGAPLKPEFKRGFEYSDGWVDDARLVVLNAMSAQQMGADILTRTAVTSARREGGLWQATLTAHDGSTRQVTARGIVNAAGPWVRDTLIEAFARQPKNGVRLIKGSHIVTRRLFEGEHCYIFQNADGRVLFAIPYEQDFTLIGTTDVALEHLDGPPHISEAETEYLIQAASEYFKQPLSRDMIVWSYAGVRPLYDDGENDPSAITRDYVLDLEATPADAMAAPLLSVYGGKLTTYRRLAEHAMEKLQPFYPKLGPAWTHGKVLPGGDFAAFDGLLADLRGRYPQLDAAWLAKLARRHGSHLPDLLGAAQSMADLGEDFGGGLYAIEVAWLMQHEWAREADDVLWRRTKCGLRVSAAQRERLADWMAARNEAQ